MRVHASLHRFNRRNSQYLWYSRKNKRRKRIFFPSCAHALLKFSWIRPISEQRRWFRMFALDSRLQFKENCATGVVSSNVPASRPDLIWIIHGYITDVHAFYAMRTRSYKKREKKEKKRYAWLGADAMRSRKRDGPCHICKTLFMLSSELLRNESFNTHSFAPKRGNFQIKFPLERFL